MKKGAGGRDWRRKSPVEGELESELWLACSLVVRVKRPREKTERKGTFLRTDNGTSQKSN